MKQALCIFALLFLSIHSFAQYPQYKATVLTPASSGYYLVSPFGSAIRDNYQMIIDSNASLIYYKPFHGTNTADFKIQPNGQITYFLYNQFLILDSAFNVIDSVSCKNGVTTDPHDLRILPNGNFLLLGFDYTTVDLTSYHYFHHNGTAGSPTANVSSFVIQELDPSKNVVFEWHSKDYLAFDGVDEFWLNDSAIVDWTHSNAVELDNDGNYIVSSRHFNEITKVSRVDSSVIWRFGGKNNQFTFIGDTTRFYGQHDIRRIDNGHITLYDNGINFLSHGARALEYELDETNHTAKVMWSYIYDSSMSSIATGNAQRIQNGNTLVNYGILSNRNVTFNVVDLAGVKVFELAFDDTIFSYRSFNYLHLPWRLPRPEISCLDSSGTMYLNAGNGYSSYRWNTGDTTRLIPVTVADTFYVFVPIGNGGFISSEKFIVTNPADPCGTIGITEILKENNMLLSPNPAKEQLMIQIGANASFTMPIMIRDIHGRMIKVPFEKYDNEDQFIADISSLEKGIYFVQCGNQVRKFVKD